MNKTQKKKVEENPQKGANAGGILEALVTQLEQAHYRTDESIIDSIQSSESHPNFADEEYDDLYENPRKAILSRTSMLLLDYRQFKAARTIQTAARGWIARRKYQKLQWAVKVIQSDWRRYLAQRIFFKRLEDTLQQRIIAHYTLAAIKIQSLWRGWWVRKNIHDQTRLKSIQVTAAEDLLYCVAFKLHHLMRTLKIPGIYSIRNSNCLSKVEQLLAAMTFKQHNTLVRWARARRLSEIRTAINKFENSTYQTAVPFPGPNYKGLCEPRCKKFYSEADADKRMHKILSMYEEVARAEPANITDLKNKNKVFVKPKKGEEVKADFCTDIVKSMKRWKILAANNLSVDSDVFQKPENVKHFLLEVQELFSDHCLCHVKPQDTETLQRCYGKDVM